MVRERVMNYLVIDFIVSFYGCEWCWLWLLLWFCNVMMVVNVNFSKKRGVCGEFWLIVEVV